MKSIKILYWQILIFLICLVQKNYPIMPTTLFSPIPLLHIRFKNQKENELILYLKQYSIPLTAFFYYSIQNNTMMTDIKKHPYITVLTIYTISYYLAFITKKESQKKIENETIAIMEDLFQILIIGRGIYNSILINNLYKNSLTAQTSTLFTTLEQFLYHAYDSWIVIFNYYQEHYQKKSLYIYEMNQIDLFEIRQVCNQEQDILPLITNFYQDKENYDYEPILKFLEMKLKLINYKISEKLSY